MGKQGKWLPWVPPTPLQILQHHCDDNKELRMLRTQLVRQERSLRVEISVFKDLYPHIGTLT